MPARALPKKLLVLASAAIVSVAGVVAIRVDGAAPGSNVPQTSQRESAPVDEATTSGWASDVDAFVAHLESTHPEPYHSISREDFAGKVVEFKTRLPQLSEWEARTEFMALVASLSREGRDGHMVLLPEDTPAVSWRMFPLNLHWFPEGFYIVDAHDELANMIGWRLVSLDGKPVRDVVPVLKDLATKDNEITLKARVPTLMTMPDLLGALGIADAEAPELEFTDGKRHRVVAPEAISMDEYLEWTGRLHPFIARLPYRAGLMWLRDQDENIWVRYLRNSDSLYVAFNLVHAPFDAALQDIKRLMAEKKPDRVIIDLRNNPGGETGQYAPLTRAFTEPPVDRPGRLLVLTGRTTFSAAANFLGDLDRGACALVVGEPPGAAPRFWNDNDPFGLPYSGLSIGVAERWWDRGGQEHPGKTFTVDIPHPLRASHYFSGRDPVLQAAIEHEPTRRCS